MQQVRKRFDTTVYLALYAVEPSVAGDDRLEGETQERDRQVSSLLVPRTRQELRDAQVSIAPPPTAGERDMTVDDAEEVASDVNHDETTSLEGQVQIRDTELTKQSTSLPKKMRQRVARLYDVLLQQAKLKDTYNAQERLRLFHLIAVRPRYRTRRQMQLQIDRGQRYLCEDDEEEVLTAFQQGNEQILEALRARVDKTEAKVTGTQCAAEADSPRVDGDSMVCGSARHFRVMDDVRVVDQGRRPTMRRISNATPGTASVERDSQDDLARKQERQQRQRRALHYARGNQYSRAVSALASRDKRATGDTLAEMQAKHPPQRTPVDESYDPETVDLQSVDQDALQDFVLVHGQDELRRVRAALTKSPENHCSSSYLSRQSCS